MKIKIIGELAEATYFFFFRGEGVGGEHFTKIKQKSSIMYFFKKKRVKSRKTHQVRGFNQLKFKTLFLDK